jgi:hypothetical protein
LHDGRYGESRNPSADIRIRRSTEGQGGEGPACQQKGSERQDEARARGIAVLCQGLQGHDIEMPIRSQGWQPLPARLKGDDGG